MKYHMQTENDTFSCWSNYSNVLQQIKLSIASGGHRVTYFFEVDKKKQNMLKVQTSTHLLHKWNIGVFLFLKFC